MTVETPIQIRFADVDMLGHVNNVNQQHYFDLGKSDYFRRILGIDHNWKEQGLITVSTRTDYMGQIRMDETITVLTKVIKVGTKSLTFSQQIINASTSEVKSESRSVLVAFNFIMQSSVPIPEHWRSVLSNNQINA